MRQKAWRAALALLFCFGWPLSCVALAAPLHLIDDRGQVIELPLEVCIQVALRTECRKIASGEAVQLPAAFYSLRVEGENHGPVALRREELRAQADGSFQAVVARKARLRVEAKGRRQPLSVSLYSPTDLSFREPAFRTQLAPDEAEAKIPAGTFLVSLALGQNAPDLQRLRADPASRVRVAYHARQGWSVVARCLRTTNRQPVGGVEVQAAATLGFGRKERPLATATSAPDGLVLLSGLDAILVSLTARHPDLLTTTEPGLAASPGTFSFRELGLAPGGRLAARISLHGRPLGGARCEIDALDPEAADPKAPYRKLWAGRADSRGVCRSERLAQGSYRLRVIPAESAAEVDRWVSVPEAGEREEDVALSPTRVTGEVRHAGRPVPGYEVETFLIGASLPKGAKGDILARGTSDDTGAYELTLWTPGRYGFLLRSPNGNTAVGTRELTTEGDEERKLDFTLDPGSVRGRVVDRSGRPMAGAKVALLWWAGGLSANADETGSFEIDAQGEGEATLTAFKNGYRESEPVAVQIAKDVPIAPVTLTLERRATTMGTVLSSAGSPVPNAQVESIVETPETGPVPYRAAQTGPDGAFEVEVPPGPQRLFVSGPGCPLSAFALQAQPPEAAGESQASPAPAALRCPDLPAALELTLLDDKGRPVPHGGVILLHDGAIVPQSVLAGHLRLLGLPSASDGSGHLVLAGLAPGSYDLFLGTLSSESTIAAGSRQGYLTSVDLPALATVELQLTLPGSP